MSQFKINVQNDITVVLGDSIFILTSEEALELYVQLKKALNIPDPQYIPQYVPTPYVPGQPGIGQPWYGDDKFVVTCSNLAKDQG